MTQYMPVAQKTSANITAIRLTMLLGAVVFLLLMLFGIVMRAAQGQIINLEPTVFYQLMTAHGAGMVGAAALTGSAIMWYFLGRYVQLSALAYNVFLGLFLVGVVLVLGAVFVGGFAGAWTFLYPLPALSGGSWEVGAATTFVLGLVAIGVAYLIFYLETGRAMIAAYGGLGRALAWPLVFTGKMDNVPPPAVIASASVTVFNTVGIVVGAAVLVVTLINLYVPSFAIDPLLAKNFIYFFGHVFINASIYMAVIAVYEILPLYTGRKWKSSRLFAIAWSAILLMATSVYPHHMMQDVAMPGWLLVMGQLVSFGNSLPLLGVTAFSMLAYLHRSGIKWDLASALLVIGVLGWSLGAVPAIIDGTISVNRVMHNTLWVPGHFHTYLLLGEVAMSLGFMAWLTKGDRESAFAPAEKAAITAYVAGTLGFTFMFLISGATSIPRRWAIHFPEWHLQDRIATAFAALSQETRLNVFRLLVEYGPEGVPAGTLSETLCIPHNTLSFHLTHMSNAQLVRSRRFGPAHPSKVRSVRRCHQRA